MAFQIKIANREINPRVINFFTFENNVNTLEFELDSYIYDEVDLRNYKAYAVTSINGKVDLTELEMSYDEAGDKLHLTWNVGEYTLTETGGIVYQITFKENADDGEGSAVWYSYKAVMINRGTVDADYKIVAEFPTIMAQWLDKINSLSGQITSDLAEVQAELNAEFALLLKNLQADLDKQKDDLTGQLNEMAAGYNASVVYIPYGETVPVENRLASRVYYQFTTEDNAQGHFEDHLGNVLYSEGLSNSLPLLTPIWSDHKLNDASYLRADTFSWHSGDIYKAVYEHLAEDFVGLTAETETVGNNTVTFYRAKDDHKIVLADQEETVADIFRETGIGWYYILDTENKRFKLPRTKYAFTGLRNSVGGYVEAGLPNITGTLSGAMHTGGNAAGGYATGAFAKEAQDSNFSYNGGAWVNHVSFDASRSSEAYGNSDTVQPPATEMYLYFFVGNYVRSKTTVDIGALTEKVNELDFADISQKVEEVKQAAIDEVLGAGEALSSYQQPLVRITETSGTIALEVNKIYTMEISGVTIFSLPKTVNTAFFNQIKVMAKVNENPVINFGTSYFMNKSAPELEAGCYDFYFDWDNHLAGWVVGAIAKGA